MTREEAINEIKSWAIPSKKGREVLETLIPELRESEDEKIRKTLINEIKMWDEHYKLFKHISKEKVLAYLEKLNDFQFDYPGLYFYDGKKLHFQGNPAMEENPYDFAMSQQEKQNEPIDPFDTKLFQDGVKEGRRLEREDIKKEQKPLSTEETELNSIAFLEQMGYTCIPQGAKPAEWSEEDKKALNSVLSSGKTVLTESNREWLKALPERFNLQPKQEWSEEDEKMLDKVCCLISPGTILNASDADYCLELKQWIVSLQERILKSLRPQPKKNDIITPNKEFFQWIYDRLVNVHNENPNVDYMISFKRRIEELSVDKPSWKPSEEQMEALRLAIPIVKNCISGMVDHAEILESLDSDLTKI